MTWEPGDGSSLWTWLLCFPDVRLVIAQVWPWLWQGAIGSDHDTLCQLCSTEGWLCWALSDKGTCLTPVPLIVHCRSQRHAPGLWAVTAMTIWTLWVPSFCKARRANCTFKVGCPWKLGTRERRGEGDTGDSEEARCGGRMEKKKKDRETDKNEEYGNEDRIWCLFKILTYTGH